LLNGAFGGSTRERIEDPITTEALKRLTSARDSITNIDPEANRRMTDQSLAAQQGAAVQNAIGASTSNLANQGMGGDIGAGYAGAVANSTAAVGAAGQFAGARTQNNMHALDAELQRGDALNRNATDYGAQAQNVNLVETQKKNFGSTILSGIAGMGTGTGILSQVDKLVRPVDGKITPSDIPLVRPVGVSPTAVFNTATGKWEEP
jgi:hypothetical protein